MMIRCMVYTFIWLPTMIQNNDKIYNYKILHLILQHHYSDLSYLRCKFIKSMVCHMFWILTSEESIELALDGINIPHGQWTLILVLSHKLIKDFNNP